MRLFTIAISLATLASIYLSPAKMFGETKHVNQTKYFLYVGSYGKGISAYKFDASTGQVEPMGLVAEITNPSFLISDEDFKHLYAVSELTGKSDGGVVSFSINREDGSLTPLNHQSSAGLAPCHLAIDKTSKMLMVANYTSGGVSVYPLKEDGSLGEMSGLMTAEGKGPNAKRQEGPHAHEVVVSANNRFAYVPDLGLDHIRIYRIDAAHASLTPNDPAFAKQDPGMGPRHMVFSPDQKFAYVINELKSDVSLFKHDVDSGTLTKVQDFSALPDGYSGENAPAEIVIDHSGKFLYSSNRGAESIAVFAVDRANGTLKQLQVISSEGKMPRGLELDPTEKYMFAGNQTTNNFVVYHVDSKSGKLNPTGQVVNTPSPVSFTFVPAK